MWPLSLGAVPLRGTWARGGPGTRDNHGFFLMSCASAQDQLPCVQLRPPLKPPCSFAPAQDSPSPQVLRARAGPHQISRTCTGPEHPRLSHMHRTRHPQSFACAQEAPPPSPSSNHSNVYGTRAPLFSHACTGHHPPVFCARTGPPLFLRACAGQGGAVKYPLYHSRKGELSGTVVCACEGLGGG